MTAPQLAPGQVVAGKYTIRALLGYGGATATYAAVLAPGRDVVIKLFSPQLAQRPDVLGALQQVTAFTNALPDPTSPILESGFDPQTGAPFMVTDLVTMPSLAKMVERGPLPPADVVLLLRGMARAVDAAHAQRMAHGALKPTNVFIGGPPERPVRVVDFGIAVARSGLPTNEGYAGAAPWMAPEQMQGAPGGAPADVFSAALVAFFAGTGRSYWRSCQGANPDLAAWQKEMAAPRVGPSARARELGSTLLPAFDGALVRALALNPAERFSSIAELADTLVRAGGAGPQKNLAMTMPLNAMPQAAQDLIRQQSGAAAPPPKPAYDGGVTLAMNSPLDPAWMPPQQQGPPPQAAPAPMQAVPYAQQPGAAAMLPNPMGGFQGAPGQMQVGAQPGYSMGPPSGTVAVPKSKAGLFIALALVGLVIVGVVVTFVVVLPRRAAVAASVTSEPAASTPPPIASTTSASAMATAPPPVETLDAGSPVAQDAALVAPTAPGDAGAQAAEAPDSGASSITAQLVIVCVPDCDSVKIDDKALDTTDAGVVPPDSVEVTVGAHTIAASKVAYQLQTKKVTLKAGQKMKETFYLSKPGAVAAPKPCGKFLERCPN